MRTGIVRTATALAFALASVSAVSAQQTGRVTGRVLDDATGQPLAGAQVMVVGTQTGVLAQADGRYLLTVVPVGEQTLRAQLIGYGTVEHVVTVTEGGTATVDFQLTVQAIAVEGLVVTALGIEREERGLGFAVQSVGAETLDRTPEVNLVQALQGQTAGVQVVQSSGRPGAASRIQIRGQSTFTGSGQPLFVIDGVPVSIDTDAIPVSGGVLGVGQAGNRGMDFDMSNVESISVLRGAAATALYGSRAAAGAVVITTKQGKAGTPLRFDISSSTTFDNAIVEGYITDWAGGVDRLFCDGRIQSQGGYCQPGYPNGFENTAITNRNYPNWGPHKDSIAPEVYAAVGDIRFEDARDQYYQTARSYNNNIRATGSLGGLGSFALGVSYLDQGDINPTGKLERLNLSANISLQFSDYLRSTTSIQRIDTNNPWPVDSWNGVNHLLLNVPPNVDIRTARNADGTPVMFGTNVPHFEWLFQNEYVESNVDRWIVSQQLAFEVVQGLTLSNNIGLDTYLDERRQFANERPWRTAEGLASGSTTQQKITRDQINDDLVLSLASQSLGESGFNVSGLLGGNVFMTERSMIRGRGTDIVIPEYYNLENFQTQTVVADLPEQQRILGVYGQATLDYNDYAYLTVTGRNDWSSTLPKHANNYFYPSVALGLVFTDALRMQSDWLNYGKLRLSYAKVGSDAPAYSLASRYNAATITGGGDGHYQFSPTDVVFPFRGQVGFLQSTQLGNPNIKPESTSEYEAGLELRMLNSRASLDVSYYHKKSFDQIFRVPSSASSGYTSIVRNAGDLRNKGWEVSLRGRPVQTENFSWDVGANWTKNKNEVIALAEGVDNIGLAGYSWPSIRIMEGLPYGVIWGYGLQRNCVPITGDYCFEDQPVGALITGDVNCASIRYNVVGDCYGLPIRTQSQIPLGSALPDWLANISTQLKYKGLGASALLDVRNGSRILNFEVQYEAGRIGRHIFTNDRYSEVLVEGINQNTGQPNDHVQVKDRTFMELWYGYDKHENQIEDGGFVKLREVTLSYDLPRTLLSQIGTESATVYVSGRNLWIHSNFSMLDPESDVYGGTSGAGQYFRQYPAPSTRGVTIGMRASF